MKRKFSLMVLLIFLIAFPRLSANATDHFASSSYREDGKLLVGWYEREGYFEKNSDGSLSGFGYDYLRAISSYTGWEYEFVEGTRRQCMTWLTTGQIDLMSPVNVNLDFSKVKTAGEVIGEDYGYLYKKNNNSLIKYEDFSNFDKATVGIESNSGLEKPLEEYCEENGFHFFEVKSFDTLAEMKNAMANGEIDILVTDSYVNIENMKVVGRFSNGRATFASTNDEIINTLNEAMEQIKLNNPNFTQDLRETYFSGSSQNNLEYSSKEGEFLKGNRFYHVVFSKNQYPISYRSDTGEGYKGIALELLERIEYQTGLKFHVFYEDTYAQGEKKMEMEEHQILVGGILSKQEVNHFTGETLEKSKEKKKYNVGFYDVRLGIVGTAEKEPENKLLVAIPEYLELSRTTLEELYPHYRFFTYEDAESCMRAILNKNVDAAILTDVGIQEMIVYDTFKDLQILQYVPGNFVSVFTIYTENKVLVDIFNKALQNIPESVQASIENENLYHIAMKQMSLSEFWKQYGDYIISFVVVLTGVLGYRKYLAEKKAKEKAYNDGVANVSSLEKLKLDMEPILLSEEKEGYHVITLDIDKFKVINDLYGYDMGDKTIAFLGKILKENLAEKELIARSNADNFVIVKKSEDDYQIRSYLDKIYGIIDSIINEKSIHYHLILKAGIYRIAASDKNLSSIIDKANLAKRNINQIFESSYQFYDETMRRKNIEEKQLENDMEAALKDGEFCVYLQPQIDLRTGKIVSAEALVRWCSPQNGLIPPAKFIPVFERNGFITKLDAFVWEETIRTVSRWQNECKMVVPIAINLSRIDVQTEGMLEKLIDLMKEYQLDYQWIKTELTESICLENDTIIMEKLHQLNDAGFKIAIDDFGTGYSSFHLLKEMPIHILKIDKSFLEFDIHQESRHMVVLRDVINLGKHLELEIIMEGVETREQAELLESIGCDIAQGYYYSKPVTIDIFEKLLEKDYDLEGGEA